MQLFRDEIELKRTLDGHHGRVSSSVTVLAMRACNPWEPSDTFLPPVPSYHPFLFLFFPSHDSPVQVTNNHGIMG